MDIYKAIHTLKWARFNSMRLNFKTPYKHQPRRIEKMITRDRKTAMKDNGQFYKWLDKYLKDAEYFAEKELAF